MSDLQAKIEKLIFDAREGNTIESESELAEVVMGWLEAELADLRQVTDAKFWRHEHEIHDLRTRLADWQRHGAKVTEDCETCDSIDSYGVHYVEDTGPHGGHTCPDCGGTGKKPRDGVERIERYRNHHVLILADSFTVEHPITCDLAACDVYTRCSNEWGGPPALPGWYLIDVDTLELSEAEDRELAFVIPAEWLEAE